jgi:hypothetical protein
MGCANEEWVAQRRRDAKEEKEFLILILKTLRLCGFARELQIGSFGSGSGGGGKDEGVAQRRRDAKEEKEFLILIFENFAPLRENLFRQVVNGADDAVTHERCAEVQ